MLDKLMSKLTKNKHSANLSKSLMLQDLIDTGATIQISDIMIRQTKEILYHKENLGKHKCFLDINRSKLAHLYIDQHLSFAERITKIDEILSLPLQDADFSADNKHDYYKLIDPLDPSQSILVQIERDSKYVLLGRIMSDYIDSIRHASNTATQRYVKRIKSY